MYTHTYIYEERERERDQNICILKTNHTRQNCAIKTTKVTEKWGMKVKNFIHDTQNRRKHNKNGGKVLHVFND